MMLKRLLAEREKNRKKVFGRDIFNNKELSFEPNMNIATPQNYRLGPGDAVIIDIYGADHVALNPESTVIIDIIACKRGNSCPDEPGHSEEAPLLVLAGSGTWLLLFIADLVYVIMAGGLLGWYECLIPLFFFASDVISTMIRVRSTELAVTNKRVLAKTGFLVQWKRGSIYELRGLG